MPISMDEHLFALCIRHSFRMQVSHPDVACSYKMANKAAFDSCNFTNAEKIGESSPSAYAFKPKDARMTLCAAGSLWIIIAPAIT